MKHVFIAVLMLCSFLSYSQQFPYNATQKTQEQNQVETKEELSPIPKMEASSIAIADSSCGIVYMKVPRMPHFPGGDDSLRRFIAHYLIYPQQAIDKGQEGMVVVKFIIDSTGKVVNPVILKSCGEYLDQASIDVVELLPNFIPGEVESKYVSTYYIVPIRFELENGRRNKKHK